MENIYVRVIKRREKSVDPKIQLIGEVVCVWLERIKVKEGVNTFDIKV